MIAQISSAQIMGIDSNGVVDEIVVTAPRYENEDDAWSGMMPEVVVAAPRYFSSAEIGMMDEVFVIAPRYENEDDAWSGMMPEVVVIAPRYDDSTVKLTLIIMGQKIVEFQLLILEHKDSETIICYD